MGSEALDAARSIAFRVLGSPRCGVKPTVPEALPLARALYARPWGGAGCCLHVVLDDVNVDDDSVASTLVRIEADACRGLTAPSLVPLGRCEDPAACRELAALLLLMSPTQRRKLAGLAGRPDP